MDNPSTLKDREKFGRNVALAMALKKDNPPPRAGRALPVDASALRERLQDLTQEITSSHSYW